MKRFALLVACSLCLSVSAAVTQNSFTKKTERFSKEKEFSVSTITVSNYENYLDLPSAILEKSIIVEMAGAFNNTSEVGYKNPAIAKRIYLLNRNIKIC